MGYVLGKFESGTNITITHDETDIGADGRLWKTTKNSVEYLFKITDDYRIAKSIDGINWTETSVLDFNNTNNATVCIDRDVEYAYILYQRASFNEIYVQTITINDMSVGTPVKITQLTGAIPLQSFVNNQDDKIVWLGSNGVLYKMDLDGTDIENITFASNSFILSKNNIAYGIETGTNNIIIANTSTMATATTTSILESTGQVTDCFISDGYVYFSIEMTGNSKNYTYRYNIETEAVTSVDITTDYLVDYQSVKGFFPYTENGIKKGLLVEDNEAGKQQVWEVNLTDLSMKVLYQISIEKVDTITTAICEFASSGTTIQKVIADCQRSDPSGDIWAEIFST